MRVMVYGTLKKGFSNHGLLKDSQLLGKSKLKGFKMYEITFPFIIKGEGIVTGEVYEVSAQTLKMLDLLEGTASGHYYRDLVVVEGYGECWIYCYTTSSLVWSLGRAEYLEDGIYGK